MFDLFTTLQYRYVEFGNVLSCLLILSWKSTALLEFQADDIHKHMNVYISNQRTHKVWRIARWHFGDTRHIIHTHTIVILFIGAPIMEGIRTFLESSTIHGLTYISTTTRRLIRVLWVCIVIAGFTGAGVLIYQSFDTWAESPITTTLPIKDVILPKITVCLPKNSYTDLNSDLMS